MDQLLAALDGAWRVLLAGVILGAGLPVLFSVGLRQLALADGEAGVMTGPAHSVPHRIAAYVVFALTIAAVMLGLAFILAGGLGYAISFQGLLPIIKKR